MAASFYNMYQEVAIMNQLKKKNNWSAYLYILPLMVLSFALLLYYLYGGNQLHGLEWDVQGNELCRLKELYENAA